MNATYTENQIAARLMREAIAKFRAEVTGSETYDDWEIVAILSSSI